MNRFTASRTRVGVGSNSDESCRPSRPILHPNEKRLTRYLRLSCTRKASHSVNPRPAQEDTCKYEEQEEITTPSSPGRDSDVLTSRRVILSRVTWRVCVLLSSNSAGTLQRYLQSPGIEKARYRTRRWVHAGVLLRHEPSTAIVYEIDFTTTGSLPSNKRRAVDPLCSSPSSSSSPSRSIRSPVSMYSVHVRGTLAHQPAAFLQFSSLVRSYITRERGETGDGSRRAESHTAE